MRMAKDRTSILDFLGVPWIDDVARANGIPIFLESNPTVHIVTTFKMAMVNFFGAMHKLFHRSCSSRLPG
jgi:hypothetical protein